MHSEAHSIAQQALADAPGYVAHIAEILADCAVRLRTGNETDGMNALARGMEDLEQFIQLFYRMAHQAKVPAQGSTYLFQQDLVGCIRELEHPIASQDHHAVSSHIEHQLLPLLLGWEPIATELRQGLQLAVEIETAGAI